MAKPTGFDTGADLLPADGPDILPDDELAAALGNLRIAASNTVVSIGRGWAFDYQVGEFIMRGQSPAEVSDVGQLRMWIEKTVRTARFAHPIYSDAYGMDLVELVGNQVTPDRIGQYATALTDALTVHDRISGVTDFKFTADPSSDLLLVGFTVVVDEGDDTITVEAVPLGGI